MTEYLMQTTIRENLPKRKIRKIEKEARQKALCNLTDKIEDGKCYNIKVYIELDTRFNIRYSGTFDYNILTMIEEDTDFQIHRG